jgi:L-methionine (R)-S-oxide reductase
LLPMEHAPLSVSGSKSEKYNSLLPQIEALISGETDIVANTVNISAVLREVFGFFWVGFYFVKNEELVLGPFQGPLACTRIQKGKGVCGAAWAEGKTQLVADVQAFPGHIACSANSQSEIVVPIFKNAQVVAVLDIDSDRINDFDSVDAENLEKLAECVGPYF